MHCRGFENIRLQHLHHTAATFLAPVRTEPGRGLFLHDRDLFSMELDLVLIDTTGTYVWRDQEATLRKRGHSKDRRPDHPQVVIWVAVAVGRHGTTITCGAHYIASSGPFMAVSSMWVSSENPVRIEKLNEASIYPPCFAYEGIVTILNLGCGTKTSDHPDVLNVDWSIYIRARKSRL